MSATEYALSHRTAPPSVGLTIMAEDFGGEVPPVDPQPGDPQLEQAIAECDQVIGLQDDARYVNRDADPNFAWTEIGEASRITGILRDRLIGMRSPKVSEPPPQPTGLMGVYGSYSGHGLAVDLYGGTTAEMVQWGPHHNLPIVAPADGRVEVYSFGTPLDLSASRADVVRALGNEIRAANWLALFAEWTCLADPLQTMFVAVWYPSAPYSVAGQRVGHLHYGHVRSDIKAGPVRKGEQFATSWNSGIQFEPGNPVARAAHVHCCAGAGTTLSPNGDLPGRLAAIAQGWAPLTDIGTVPGPADYQVPNKFCAGRLYQDFVRAGRQPPPMPG